jgi:hypothetical protein
VNGYFFIILSVILGGLGISVWGWRIQRRSQRIQQWPRTTGVIEESAMGAAQSDLLPHIRYAYAVGGRDYRQTFQFPSGTHPLPEFSRAYLEKYPLGAKVQVYYAPQDPQQSTLEPGAQGDWLILLLGVLMVVGGIAALAVSW